MTLYEYSTHLSSLLDISSFPDISLNGVQIGAEDRELKKVAFAVDASLHSIREAVKEKADILVVHHGLFWGYPIAIDGDHYRRVKEAIEGGLMLYAAHIPLDAHPIYGNNAMIASILSLEEKEGFGEWKGNTIGVKGMLPKEMDADEIATALGFTGPGLRMIDGGKKSFRSVAIVSGAGSSDVEDAIKAGVDLFITGEIKHDVYWSAVESGLSVLAGGHYRSEVFGVSALKEYTSRHGIDTVFIEGDTGL